MGAGAGAGVMAGEGEGEGVVGAGAGAAAGPLEHAAVNPRSRRQKRLSGLLQKFWVQGLGLPEVAL